MKTEVEITIELNQCIFKKGERGYIDGYIRGANNVPLAAVVVDERIDLVQIYALKAIKKGNKLSEPPSEKPNPTINDDIRKLPEENKSG